MRIKVPGQAEEQVVFVQGGFLEVQPDVVTVLSDTAIRAHDLDEAKALEAKQAAEEAMQNRTSKEEIARAESELAGAMAQLAAIRRLRKGRSTETPRPNSCRHGSASDAAVNGKARCHADGARCGALPCGRMRAASPPA